MSNITYIHSGLLTVNIPGAGRGYRASSNIPKGSLIMKETPWFTISPDRVQHIDQVLASLAAADQSRFQQFLTLVVSHQFLSDPSAVSRGRFLTNALPCGLCAGLFLLAARFNSSCKPNVHYDWDEARGVMQFRTMRDIKPYEELTIAYNVKDLLQPRAIRQDNIRRSSGFNCSCSACILPLKWDEAGQVSQNFSDNTRTWLRSVILSHIDSTIAESQSRIRTISEALQALHQDGLYHYRDTLFYDGYLVCARAGDGNNAMLWLQRARDAAVTVVGDADPRVILMSELLATHNAASFGARTILIPPPHL